MVEQVSYWTESVCHHFISWQRPLFLFHCHVDLTQVHQWLSRTVSFIKQPRRPPPRLQPLHPSTAVSTRDNMSGLNNLPPEILRRIYEYALPQRLTFSFDQTYGSTWDGNRLEWIVFVAKCTHERVIILGERFARLDRRRPDKYTICTTTFCKHDNVDDDIAQPRRSSA